MKSWWKLALVLGAIALSMGVGIHAQRTAQDITAPQGSSELLQEVRALRIALERFTVGGARSQLLLGRLQMQEGRLATLGSQAREIRARLVAMQRDREATVAEANRLAETLPRIMSITDRRSMEFRVESMRAHVKRLEREEKDLQAEDTSAADALATEQTRWLEFNQRLEELERVLASQKL